MGTVRVGLVFCSLAGYAGYFRRCAWGYSGYLLIWLMRSSTCNLGPSSFLKWVVLCECWSLMDLQLLIRFVDVLLIAGSNWCFSHRWDIQSSAFLWEYSYISCRCHPLSSPWSRVILQAAACCHQLHSWGCLGMEGFLMGPGELTCAEPCSGGWVFLAYIKI